MEKESPTTGKGDILGRKEIEQLVGRFYSLVRKDDALGPIFDETARVDWDQHLPKICDFWETVLFRTGSYKGNPLAVHRHLQEKVAMGRPLFDRWLTLFTHTVDELFAGENAGHIKRVAVDMADVIHSRLHQLPGMSDPVGGRR